MLPVCVCRSDWLLEFFFYQFCFSVHSNNIKRTRKKNLNHFFVIIISIYIILSNWRWKINKQNKTKNDSIRMEFHGRSNIKDKFKYGSIMMRKKISNDNLDLYLSIDHQCCQIQIHVKYTQNETKDLVPDRWQLIFSFFLFLLSKNYGEDLATITWWTIETFYF